MIEQLLGAVKGYVKHEKELFETISSLRASLLNMNVSRIDEVNQESRKITSDILAIAEAYPDLKANETVIKLMDAIVSVEDEIARQRYTYNNIIQEFNTMMDTFPSNIVARSQGMIKLDYLEFEEELRERPEIMGIGES
jgi:LemA protein